MITIDKNVPMPEGRARSRYPYADMEVGDSFFVVTNGTDENATARRLRGSSFTYGKKAGSKFSVRKMDNGFRVWRVA